MTMQRMSAFITGITGQDGSYLARYLLSLGYEVHGLVRRTSVDNLVRLRDILPQLTLHTGDMADAGSLMRAVLAANPDEVYHLAAQSHVHVSNAEPEHTADINALGTIRLLDIIRTLKPSARFYNAATSEMFGNTSNAPLTENSPMRPDSPYAAAKLYAYNMTRLYRDSYGLYACSGILFNHESPLRGCDFVTGKIARFTATIKSGHWNGEPLKLGNLNARRDWGHAADYVRGMHAMLQQSKPDDYILATGTAHSVRDYAAAAFDQIGQPLKWIENTATLPNGQTVIVTDASLRRPIDIECLIGDATKAKQTLNWKPRITFSQLVADMVENARI